MRFFITSNRNRIVQTPDIRANPKRVRLPSVIALTVQSISYKIMLKVKRKMYNSVLRIGQGSEHILRDPDSMPDGIYMKEKCLFSNKLSVNNEKATELCFNVKYPQRNLNSQH